MRDFEDVEIIGMLRSYVNATLKGMGAIKGSSVSIASIARNQENTANVVTFSWEDNTGETHTSTMTVPDGLSAYQVAVKNGFSGTEQEWLDSLHGSGGSYDDTEIRQEINAMLPLIGEYLPISNSNSNKKRSVAAGATNCQFYIGAFVETYGITSASELDFEVSAETSSGNVVAFNRVAVNWSGKAVYIYFDELAEQTTFVCKCSVIK